MTRASLIVLCLVFSTAVLASPANSPRPGGTVVIDVAAATAESAPVVMFGGKRVLLLKTDDHAFGIPIICLLKICLNGESKFFNFKLVDILCYPGILDLSSSV